MTSEERQATLDAISLIIFLKANAITYKKIIKDGSDIYVIIPMSMDESKIIEIEEHLTFFANEHILKYDGWAAFE